MKESQQGYISQERHRANIQRAYDRMDGKQKLLDTWLEQGEKAYEESEYLSDLRKRIRTATKLMDAMR